MKTLYNYINEGLLAGQNATMHVGDKYASIVKKAETQLDELYSVCDNGGVSFFEIEKGVYWKYTGLEGCDLCLACGSTPKFIDDIDLKLSIRRYAYENKWRVYFINEFRSTHCQSGGTFADMDVPFKTAKTFKQLCKKVLKPAFKDLDSFKKAFTIYEKS